MPPRARARELLKGLHNVMAARAPNQKKFDRIVTLIADALQSDVASLYILHRGMLELYATHGLKKSAVHVTRLAPGQGLVGTIAASHEILNLSNAAGHKAFAFRPETGEEKYHSFAGVPIIRHERTIGVLSVQHRKPHIYDAVEIEALQTVAMVLAELIAGASLADGFGASPSEPGTVQLTGMPIVTGLARGVAVFHEPRVEIRETVADDVDAERARLADALKRMRSDISRMLSGIEFGGPVDHREILETYRMFAFDKGWADRIYAGVESGLTAEAAIEAVAQNYRARFGKADDPYIRERLHDLDDLSNRLIRTVSGQFGTASQIGLTEDTILLARNLGPAELLEYDRKFLKGIVLEEGSATSHATIIARATGVPLLGRCAHLRQQVMEGDPLLLNATSGTLFVRPSPALIENYGHQVRLRARRQAEYRKIRDLPAVTRDGVRIRLSINAGLRSDLPALAMTNADGIGLFRTELQFMVSETLPRKGRQIELYRAILDAAGEKPVVFRTVDIGGDKVVPYLGGLSKHEENPAMGWRALRLALERPALLSIQARALLEASAGRTLNIMFPMVAEPWEFRAARAIVEARRVQLERLGVSHAHAVRYGVMLEVPALAMALDELLPEIDFLSIGTNDLTQFLLAADRSNPKLANRYDWLARSILRYLQMIFSAADTAEKEFSVCGEMGGRAVESLALIAMGAKSLSITPAAIGPIKAMVRSTTLGPLRDKMQAWLATPGANIRKLLETEIVAQGIRIP